MTDIAPRQEVPPVNTVDMSEEKLLESGVRADVENAKDGGDTDVVKNCP